MSKAAKPKKSDKLEELVRPWVAQYRELDGTCYETTIQKAKLLVKIHDELKPTRGALARFYREVGTANEAMASRARAVVANTALKKLCKDDPDRAPVSLTALAELARVPEDKIEEVWDKLEEGQAVGQIKKLCSAHVDKKPRKPRRSFDEQVSALAGQLLNKLSNQEDWYHLITVDTGKKLDELAGMVQARPPRKRPRLVS